MNAKLEGLRHWDEIYKYLDEDFNRRKLDNFYVSLRKIINEHNENVCESERIANTEIIIKGSDEKYINNVKLNYERVIRQGNYISTIRDLVNSINAIFDDINNLKMVKRETVDFLINNVLDGIHPERCQILSGNPISSELITTINNKLLDKDYLPDLEELKSVYTSLKDFFNILKFVQFQLKGYFNNQMIEKEENIYKCFDPHTLIEGATYLERKLVNKAIHPDHKKLVKHIDKQLKNIGRQYDFKIAKPISMPSLDTNPTSNMIDYKQSHSYGNAENTEYVELGDNNHEISSQANTLKYYTFKEKDDYCQEIYSSCSNAFNCDYKKFRLGIETADFNGLIKKKNIVQDLTYRLSGIMDKDWYTDMCNNMSWKKSTCSGKGSKLQNNQTIKRLNRVLKRPSCNDNR